MADAICSRIARTGRSMPAISTMVSMRASESRGELACTVVSEPSWPVFMACSMSSAAPSRTSPTTMRSGRIRSELRTRSRTVTWPRPSMLGGPGLQPQHVLLVQLQLGRVLDGDDALVGRQELRQHVERRRLAGAGAAGDEHVEPAPHAGGEQVGHRPGQRAEGDQIVHVVRVGGELADRQHRAVEGDRRHHRVDPAAVGQAGVDHRAALVDPAADPGHDLVDDAAQVLLVDEGRVDRHDPAEPLDVDPVRAVDHDLADVRVAQQRLERPVAEDLVADLGRDPGRGRPG